MEKEWDLRLQLPNHALIVGASMSGKTQLVMRILRAGCFHPLPKTVLFYYDQWQDEYLQLRQDLQRYGIQMKSLQGGSSLTMTDLDKSDGQTLVVIDDASEETAASMDIAKLTTNGRHKNVSLWLIWHSLFSKHPASRVIAQNSAYMFFLPSPRMRSQIHTLDSQLRYKGALVSAYTQAMEEPNRDHRYLLLDMSPNTPEGFRMRSHITQSEVQHLYQKV